MKQSILREAAQKLRHTPYSVLDDETFIVMDDEQIDDIPAKIGSATCGKIAMGEFKKVFQRIQKNSEKIQKIQKKN